MKVAIRFSVTSFNRDYDYGVVGSTTNLGGWNPHNAIVLQCCTNPSIDNTKARVSAFYATDVIFELNDIIQTPSDSFSQNTISHLLKQSKSKDFENCRLGSENVKCTTEELLLSQKLTNLKLEYKFIRWPKNKNSENDITNNKNNFPIHQQQPPVSYEGQCLGSTMNSTINSTEDEDILDIFQFRCGKQRNSSDLTPDWEGGENREYIHNCRNLITIEPQEKILCILPVASFKENGEGACTEYYYTTQYYYTVKDYSYVHYDKIINNLFCGTTPRSVEQIQFLKENLKITAVLNLQTLVDAIFASPLQPPSEYTSYSKENPDSAVEHLHAIYQSQGLVYTWLPTTDMSTPARTACIPTAAYVIKGLIQNNHVLYVHCNAGVGRSVASICGYLCYVLGLPLRCTEYLMKSRRSVAYWDEVAMANASVDFIKKFGH